MKTLASAKVLLTAALLFCAAVADDYSLVPRLCLNKPEPDVGELRATVQGDNRFDFSPIIEESLHLDMMLVEYTECVTSGDRGTLISLQWTFAAISNETDRFVLPRIGPSTADMLTT